MEITLRRKLNIAVIDTATSTVDRVISQWVEEGSASLSQVLFSEENLTFGSYNSSKFEITLYGATLSKNDYIQVYFDEPTNSAVVGEAIAGNAVVGIDAASANPGRTYLFSGYVESVKRESANPVIDGIHIVAYDVLYFLKDRTKFTVQSGGSTTQWTVSQWWVNLWSDYSGDPSSNPDPLLLKDVRNSLCEFAGLNVVSAYDDPSDLVNNELWVPPKYHEVHVGDSYTIAITPLSSEITFSQMMTWICEMQCTFPYINGLGQLDFIDLTQTNTHDIVGKYELDTSDVDDEESNVVGRVVFVLDGNTVESCVIDSSHADNAYTVADNLFVDLLVSDNLKYNSHRWDATIYGAADDIGSNLHEIVYYPASFNMIYSDLNIRLGDTVIFHREESEQEEEIIKVARVVTNELSGPLLVEQAIGSEGDNNYKLDETSGSASPYESGVTWDTRIQPYMEVYDNLSAQSVLGDGTTKNLTSFTLPQGMWIVQVTAIFTANASGMRSVWISTSNNGGSYGRGLGTQNAVSSGLTCVHVVTPIKVTQPTRTFYVVAKQTSGTTLSVSPRVAFFGNKE